ncbi:MAG: hypothetical protein AAF362_14510 [Pseudomonadota bacterium]
MPTLLSAAYRRTLQAQWGKAKPGSGIRKYLNAPSLFYKRRGL